MTLNSDQQSRMIDTDSRLTVNCCTLNVPFYIVEMCNYQNWKKTVAQASGISEVAPITFKIIPYLDIKYNQYSKPSFIFRFSKYKSSTSTKIMQ